MIQKTEIMNIMMKCTAAFFAVSLLPIPSGISNTLADPSQDFGQAVISMDDFSRFTREMLPSGIKENTEILPENSLSEYSFGEDFTAENDNDTYKNYAVSKADNYVNVRTIADTSAEIVGHIYNGSVCEIVGETESEDGTWLQIVSGNVEGYAKAEFFLYGDEAAFQIKDYITTVAEVECDRLNIRKEADAESEKVGSAKEGDLLKVVSDEELSDFHINTEQQGETAEQSDSLQWVQIEFGNGQTGYVCLDYVVIRTEYATAKTMEEERAEAERKAAEAKRKEAERLSAEASKTDTGSQGTDFQAADTSYSDNAELRANIIEYAKQFVGMNYVSGGKSLSGGTDCSGFTCFVLAEFGYSIGRTPASQYSSAGRSISLSEAKPGDIVCYGSGNCTHVAFYMGDNKIIHEANSKDGCIISDVTIMNILGVKNVID